MDADVTVVGAGPVGLLLAAELALGGVSTLVLERLDAPDETIKAGSISVPSAAALDRRGLLPDAERAQGEMLATILPLLKTGGMPSKAGHFAALMLDRTLVDDADPDLGAQPSSARATLVPQAPLEAILARHAARLGVAVRRGVVVTGLGEEADAVVVDTPTGPVRSSYVVGCDGGRSVVRHAAGIGFPGTDAEITGRQAVVDVADPEVLGVGWQWTPTGVYCHGPFPGRILTVEFDGPPDDRDAPVTLDELQASLRRASGTGVTLTALHGAGTRWTDHARQAETYRRGRVLLAGDAAHVHSPFSGQGLNLGIGDAINLGWKLAATVRGDAPDGLLDTFTAERHPIGARVLEWTRAQVALMRPDPKTAALRDVVGDLMNTREGMTHMVRTISGVTQTLDLPGAHRLVGRLAPELALADGTRLPDHAHGGGFVLLDRTPDGVYAGLAGDRVTVVVDGSGDPAALLVRPDGVVAWAASGDDDGAGLESALRRWVGAPATAALHPA